MKSSNVLTDLYKGQWAITFDAYRYMYTLSKDILKGKDLKVNFKAKNLIDFYDENNDPVKPNVDGFIEIPEGSTAVVNMIGPLVSYGNWWFYGADEIVAKLDKLDRNPNIKAILIYMDGPGGAVGAISPFVTFGAKRNKKKPLGIVFEEMCSAHLYSGWGLQPDFVWAANNISATAGSLGVMVSWLDDQKYLEMIGLEKIAIYPDESKDKSLPVRLALEGKYDLIKTEMLSPLAIRFQNDMIRLNPDLKSKESGVLTGKVFYAEDAVKVGFAQKIGSFEEAFQYINVLSELNHYKSNV